MIAVVYLVWGPFGTRHLRDFVASYRQHRAGADHELVVVYNGVEKDDRLALDAELEALDHRLIELPTPVLDLMAYTQAAELLRHERVCFLNSYSMILAPDWLAKLNDALNQPKAGLVGATGSWASHRSARLNSLFLPNPYKGVLPKGRFRTFPALESSLEAERSGHRGTSDTPQPGTEDKLQGLRWYVIHALKGLARTPSDLHNFDPFPAHHVRTNAFMMKRSTIRRVEIRRLKSKLDAYTLESGHRSITRQVEGQGLRALVVASEGVTYEQYNWPLSETFWQGRQEGLMIGDNQTRLYEGLTLERRRFLSVLAWGLEARPEPPKEPFI